MGTAGSGVTAFRGVFLGLFPSSFPVSALSLAEVATLLVPHGLTLCSAEGLGGDLGFLCISRAGLAAGVKGVPFAPAMFPCQGQDGCVIDQAELQPGGFHLFPLSFPMSPLQVLVE